MRGRLFWKICLAFWCTALLINQGSWLIFFLTWDPPPSLQWVMDEKVAPVQLASARNVIETGGMPAYQALRAAMPVEQQDAIEILPVAKGTQPPAPAPNKRVMMARTPEGQQLALVYVNKGESRREWSFLRSLRRSGDYMIAAAVGGLLFAAGLAWYLTRPIRTMQRGFGRLAAGQLDTRLLPDMGSRRDEIADLARDFDAMAARLEQLLAMRDQLLHDVSHELRSPLARLNLAIALMRQNPAKAATSVERIETEVRRLDELVGELLSLARLESGGQGQDSYFELGGLVENILANARYEAKASGVRVDARFTSDGVLDSIGDDSLPRHDLIVQGEFELMRRALENVVRNAIKLSTTGQVVEVELRVERGQDREALMAPSSGRAILFVRDEGPGIPDDKIASMFDPFVRLSPQASGGFGLGLAIARRAVMALGGRISARNRSYHGRPINGLEVQIDLPLYRGGEKD